MKIKKTITLLSILVSTTFSYAQVLTMSGNMQDFAMLDKVIESNNIKIGGTTINTTNLEGSPYLHEKFLPGQIIDNDKKRRIKAYIRYRILDDVFEVKKSINDEELHILKRSEKYDVMLNNHEMFTFQYNLPVLVHGTNSGYVKILVDNNKENKASLYKRFGQMYNPGEDAKSTYQKGKAASISTEKYYMIKIGNKAYNIEPHKRKAADAFPDKNEMLVDYIKDNKLKFKGDEEEKDLIQLVEYYNSLN